MAMAIDSRQQYQFNGMSDDPMRFPAPQFTNPWVSAPPTDQSQLNAASLPASTLPGDSERYLMHAPNISAACAGAPISPPSLATGIFPMDPDFSKLASCDACRSYETGCNASLQGKTACHNCISRGSMCTFTASYPPVFVVVGTLQLT